MIQVSLRTDDMVDEFDEFVSTAKAEEYFYRLCRTRSRYPTSVVATADGEWRMIYRIDDVYAGNRWVMSLDLETGLPVKRRYIPAKDELTGRKSKVTGVQLPGMIIPDLLYEQMKDRADRAGITMADLRRQAYKYFIKEYDTNLDDILGD